MTFDPNVPNAGQSPGLFPPGNNTNFARLKALINAEHVFNDTAAVTDGVHRQATMIARLDPVSLPAGTNGMYYNKVVGSTALPFYYDGTSIYALAPVRASVTFNNLGVVQGNAFNATVALLSPGEYEISFTIALPSKYPQFSLTCIQTADGNPMIGKVLSLTTVGATVTKMSVRFVNTINGQTITNIIQGNLIVFGG
jgi:hypothetical protein